jgi:hypothetical protein
MDPCALIALVLDLVVFGLISLGVLRSPRMVLAALLCAVVLVVVVQLVRQHGLVRPDLPARKAEGAALVSLYAQPCTEV